MLLVPIMSMQEPQASTPEPQVGRQPENEAPALLGVPETPSPSNLLETPEPGLEAAGKPDPQVSTPESVAMSAAVSPPTFVMTKRSGPAEVRFTLAPGTEQRWPLPEEVDGALARLAGPEADRELVALED